MAHQLRDYQQQAIHANYNHWFTRGFRGTINHLATGLGKTTVATETVNQLFDLDQQRVMFVVHTTDLVWQAYYSFCNQRPELKNKGFTKFSQPGIGIVMGVNDTPNARIVIGTPQTLSGQEEVSVRLDRLLNFGKIDLLIIDEAHYAASRSYLNLANKLLEHNTDLKILGLTATPMRSDGLALRQPLAEGGNMFDTIAISRNIKWGIENGYLCPILPPLLIQTDMALPEGAGDVDTRARMIDVSNWAELVVQAYLEQGNDRIGVYFLPSVEHSIKVAEEFNKQGVPAFHVDGDKTIDPDGKEVLGKSERKRLYKHLAAGDIRIACNYNVLTHGWDLPQIALIGLARPTESPVLTTQLIGRGTRLHPDKSDLKILDYALKNVPLCLSGSLLGYSWDDQTQKLEADDEVEIEELSDGVDLRDLKQDDQLVNGSGVIIRVGTLFRKLSEAWFFDELDGDSLSLSLSDSTILVVMLPNYTLANSINEGIANGTDFLNEHPDNVDARLFFENLQLAHELFSQYTLWQLNKQADRWVKPDGWLQAADSVELLFDYAAPIIATQGQQTLSSKNRTWRRSPPTDAQLNILRRLKIKEVPTARGVASQMISHYLAVPKIRSIIHLIQKNCGDYGHAAVR